MSGAVSGVTGVVLAGGESRRMGGEDKAFLRVNGKKLIESVLERLGAAAEELVIVTNAPEDYASLGPRLVRDEYPGTGALGGIYSGLAAAGNERCLVVACDMPFLNADLLCYLADLALDHDAVLPYLGDVEPRPGRRGTAKTRDLHPLHAAYRRRCMAAIRRAIKRDDLRTISFLPEVDVRFVDREDIEQFDPQYVSFFNANTPADLDQARQLAVSRP